MSNIAPPVRASAWPSTWVLIAGEYPPQAGGVADYTRGLARMLGAAGDRVVVFAPPCDAPDVTSDAGVTVHRLSNVFGSKARAELRIALDAIPRPRAVIVQYVPQSFGLRGCNVPFTAWLRTLRGSPLWVMFHEVTVTVTPRTPLKYRLQAIATRAMARLAIGAADAAFVSTERWIPLLHALSKRVPDVTCIPVPSNIELYPDAKESRLARQRYGTDSKPLFGHFGTYREGAIRDILTTIAPKLLARTDGAHMLFLGAGSDAFASALAEAAPHLADRISGTGSLAAEDVSAALSACDVLVQPYDGGVTTRRGSIIGELALGVAIVTTDGAMTEPLWRQSGAVVLVEERDLDGYVDAACALAADAPRRSELAQSAAAFYLSTFAMEHTVSALKNRAAEERPLVA